MYPSTQVGYTLVALSIAMLFISASIQASISRHVDASVMHHWRIAPSNAAATVSITAAWGWTPQGCLCIASDKSSSTKLLNPFEQHRLGELFFFAFTQRLGQVSRQLLASGLGCVKAALSLTKGGSTKHSGWTCLFMSIYCSKQKGETLEWELLASNVS